MSTECNARSVRFPRARQPGRHRPIRRRSHHFGRRRPATAGGGGQDRHSAAIRRLLHRPPRPRAGGTLGRRTAGPAGVCPGLGLRRPQRPRHLALRSALGGVGGQGRSDRAGPSPRRGSRQVAGGQEHAQPPGTDARGSRRQEPLQEDRRPASTTSNRSSSRRFWRCIATPPKEIVLDLDATDDPIHGHQLGRFFHGYYDNYCYLPLYIFCGEHLLCAKLRPSDIDGAAGSVKQLAQTGRADSPPLARGADHRAWRQRFLPRELDALVRREPRGLRASVWRKTPVYQRILGKELHEAKLQFEATGQAARVFKDFTYQTRKSWSRPRRVVGKAEHLAKGSNPRFVVTSLPAEELDARALYEDLYCARGEMENRIKEQQLCLFADRTSCATMRANQLRLWLSSVAYTLLVALRQFGLQGTEMAQARCDTIRLKLLKLGALVRTTVRRVWISLSQSWPYQRVFAQVYENLRRWSLPLPASG